MVIYGCKDYIADEDVKIKGVPKKAKEIKPGVFEYTQFMGQQSHLRAGNPTSFITRRITKTNKREYTKAIVTKSGYTKPHTMIGESLVDEQAY